MGNKSLKRRRDRALGSGAELFYGKPLEIVRGEGAYLYDRDGKRYVDLYNNVPCVGHANPAVVRAMAEQQGAVNVHSRYLHEGIVSFAERLTGLNHDGIESVIFGCSGTEAVEVALMLARHVTGQHGIVCTDATYHGNSTLVDSMSDLHTQSACPDGIASFPFPERYRPISEGLGDGDLKDAYLKRAEASIAKLKSDGHGFAALIVCSIFANEGVPDVPAGFMQELTDLVHREGGLMISDEVQTGHGRTGRWWGYESMGFTPDVLAMGKPMGNGMPISATLSRHDWISSFRAAKDYFNTTAQTPLQAAVGMAVLDEIERMDLVSHAQDVGDQLTQALKTRVNDHDFIGDVRGKGLFISIDLVRDKESKTPNAALARELSNDMMSRGFLLSNAGKYSNCLKVRPPLVFSQSDADAFLAAFDECLAEKGG